MSTKSSRRRINLNPGAGALADRAGLENFACEC